jgi:hypothetical protein
MLIGIEQFNENTDKQVTPVANFIKTIFFCNLQISVIS